MQLRPTYPVLTERLSLRPLDAGDVDALVTYRGRPDVCRYLPFAPMTPAVVAERLRGDLGRTEITAEGQSLTLGVRVRGSDVLIGDVVLFLHSEAEARGELGYVFHPDAGGLGYATEACAAVLGLAFDDLGLALVTARLDARNTASARLLRRLGMHRQPAVSAADDPVGGADDVLVFALLAEQWPGAAHFR